MDSAGKNAAKAADVVVTGNAFNLACSWVQGMSGGSDLNVEEESKNLPADDGADVRPLRLGLGAKYLSHSQANRVSSQVDKKLRAKLGGAGAGFSGDWRGNKATGREDDAAPAEDDELENEDDDSRASSFKKRSNEFVRPTFVAPETANSRKKKRTLKGP